MSPASAPGRAAAGRGGWRILRASAVASIAVLIAVGGHLAGGGAAPGPGLLALVVVVTGALCAHLSRHRWSPRTLTGTLLAVQALMHVLCSLGPAPSSETPGALMLAWHLVATAVSLGVLMYGETLTWRLVDVIALRPVRAALDVLNPPARGAPRAAIAMPAPDLFARSWWARSLAPVRGPPV